MYTVHYKEIRKDGTAGDGFVRDDYHSRDAYNAKRALRRRLASWGYENVRLVACVKSKIDTYIKNELLS